MTYIIVYGAFQNIVTGHTLWLSNLVMALSHRRSGTSIKLDHAVVK